MQRAAAIFYGLSIFVLMTAFFVLQPSKAPEVAAFQQSVKLQVSVAWQQTIGDGPYFDTLANIYDGVTGFYMQASNQAIALLSQPDSDAAVYYVFHTTYQDFAQIFKSRQVHLAQTLNSPGPDKFMTEAAIDNIIPDSIVQASESSGVIAGAAVNAVDAPVNQENSWVTIQDNFTGQKYCLAIYNGEVNKYLGECKSIYR
ncbi:MAG: hypothetical protein WDN47_05415 [Candidatus Doudnabacteria bacterium]